MWKISSMMTPEQKKAILAEINKSKGTGDVISQMMKVMAHH
jgi:hypothetical protein